MPYYHVADKSHLLGIHASEVQLLNIDLRTLDDDSHESGLLRAKRNQRCENTDY